jgi:ribosomal protein L12E/L44/L45/RPP1/RPP2
MKNRLASACVAALSLVAAVGCSSDSPSSRDSLTNALVASAKESGVDIDKTCVSGVVAKFSDEDLKVLQASTKDDDLDTEALSSDGQALLIDIFDCSGGTDGGSVPASGDLTTTQAAILEQLTASLSAQGLTVDEDCLKALVVKLDSATIASQDAEALAALGTEAVSCVTQS